MSEIQSLLLIDDNEERSNTLKAILEFLGTSCIQASSSQWLKELNSSVDLKGIVLGQLDCYSATKDSDSKGSDADDIDPQILSEIANLDKQLPIILLGRGCGLLTKENTKFKQIVGTLNWPIKQNELLQMLHACHLCRQEGKKPNEVRLSGLLSRKMVGSSQVMEQTRQLIEQVASSEASVLILGESGTGKEVAARGIHDLSDRAKKPFVPINCGAIPAELLESELFGHEKGAFTGALSTRKGRFELAEGGTIFLDEIGDMPMPMQVKLLRVLQERTFERVGGGQTIKSNVRIIAATHRQLTTEVKENRFREDLFYRLNVFPIEIPSLRERVEDIEQLVSELISRLEKEKRGSVRLSPNAIQSLMLCQWPGNVRELANLMERMGILHPYGVVDLKDLPQDYRHEDELSSYETPELASKNSSLNMNSIQSNATTVSDLAILPADGVDLKAFIKNIEINYIEQALNDEDWVVARAAKRLTMQRTTLVEKMRKYKLHKT